MSKRARYCEGNNKETMTSFKDHQLDLSGILIERDILRTFVASMVFLFVQSILRCFLEIAKAFVLFYLNSYT